MQKTTKDELRTIKEIVRTVLTHSPRARGDDDYLFYVVCGIKATGEGIDLEKMSFSEAFGGGWPGLPRYKSVVRLRRLAQKENPDLEPAERTRENRKKREADMVEFTRQKGEV